MHMRVYKVSSYHKLAQVSHCIHMRLREPTSRVYNLRKRWRREFSTRRVCIERRFIERRKELRENGDELDMFLCDQESLSTSIVYIVITKFCRRSAPMQNRGSRAPENIKSSQGWIDIRAEFNGNETNCTEWLNATRLEEELDKVRIPRNFRSQGH